MVSVVGGLISSTIWRVVGGGDSHSVRRPGGEPKKRHVLSTPRAHFVRRPITHIHPQDGLLGTSRVGGDHFGKGLACGDNDDRQDNDRIDDIKDPDTDWVVFDINSTTAVPCSKTVPGSKLALSSVMTPTTNPLTNANKTSPVSSKENENTALIFNEDNFACPPLTKPILNLLPYENTPEKVIEQCHFGTICHESNSDDLGALFPTKSLLKSSVCDPRAPGREVNEELPTCCISNIASFSSVFATPGNYHESEHEEASPRQCIRGVEVSNCDTRCGSGVNCHAPAMAAINTTAGKDMEAVSLSQNLNTVVSEPPKPPPASLESSPEVCQDVNTTMEITPGDGVASCSGGEVSNSKQVPDFVPSVTYREDIRAYDIYHITPNQSPDAHYSRLPSVPPTLTDSDSDPDDARWKQGIRKRKRRISGRKEGEGGKRYREGEETDDEDNGKGLDDITVYTSPYLEDYTNRISILHRLSSTVEDLSSSSNGQKRVTFSPSTSTLHHHHDSHEHSTTRYTASTTSKTPTQTSTTKISCTLSHTPSISPSNTASSKNQSSNPPRNNEDDEPSDDDNINIDNDDDDDEASTVVPDDFDDETDSDIEVLVHSESWVDLSNQPEVGPDRVTPLPFGNGEETIRLLREAQKESNHSSARVSLASSRRDTPRDSPHDSPKSPPNSPNTELTTDPEEAILKGVYINYYNKEGDFIRVEKNTETDWIWDWSSRPDQTPPKEWRFSHPGKGAKRGASIRRVMVGKSSLFSRDVLYTLLITNVLSLLIGTGIGIWLSKRSSSGAIVTLPIN